MRNAVSVWPQIQNFLILEGFKRFQGQILEENTNKRIKTIAYVRTFRPNLRRK